MFKFSNIEGYLVFGITITLLVHIFTIQKTLHSKSSKYCHNTAITSNQLLDRQLDPEEKFLFPIFPYGPNNQVKSFFESLKVAEILNRTLVMTPMFRHSSDEKESTDPFIPPYLRLNIPEIASKHRLAKDSDAIHACQYSYDRILYTKKRKEKNRLNNFNAYYGIKLPAFKKPKFDKLQLFGDQQIRATYSTPEKCVIFLGSFNTIMNPIQGYDLLKFPDFIYEYANHFSNYQKYDFTFHWRFNEDDWGSRCKNEVKTRNQKQCEMLMSGIGPSDIVNLIHESIYNQTKNGVTKHRWYIHVSAPPSEMNFIDKVHKKLKNSPFDVQLTGTKIIQNFLHENYDTNCPLFKHYWNEIVSLIEQALIEQSETFYYWPLSTWSERIQELRAFKLEEHKTRDFVEYLVSGQMKRLKLTT